MDKSSKNQNLLFDDENTNINDKKEIQNIKEIKSDNKNNDNELNNILDRNPLEELKLIKEKIKLENEKIDEIDSKLDRIKNNKNSVKRAYYLNDDLKNLGLKKQNILNNITSHKIKPILTEKNININKSLDIQLPSANRDLIHQKMKDLKNMEIINLRNESKLNLPVKKDNNLFGTKDNLKIEIDKLIELEKEEKKKINENKIKFFHDKELEMEKKRKKIVEQMNNFPSNLKNKNNSKNYYYLTAIEKEEIRRQKEQQLLEIEKEKRKQKYLPISSEELNNFSKEVVKNKKIYEKELGAKKKQMEEIWKERKNLLPKYHSKFMDLNIEYDKEAKEELILRQEKLKNKELERINFGKDVVKNYLPKKLNDKLKIEREQRINELNGKNRLSNIKELGNKLKEKSKKLVQSQPKKFKKNIFVIEPSTKEQQTKKLTGKAVDYLLEQRNKNNKLINGELIQSNSAKKMKQWNKMLENDEKNVVNNLQKIKIEASLMNNKANNINQIIKLESNENLKQNELKTEASNYFISSIQAKLQILNKIMSP